jgi:probable HAF family extracellular repeat protein
MTSGSRKLVDMDRGRHHRRASVAALVLVAALVCGAVARSAPATTSYVVKDLGTIGGTWSSASGITENGQVIGQSIPATCCQTRGFWWTGDEGMVDLGTLGGIASRPRAANELGQVVGDSTAPTGSQHAFSWTKASGLVDLGTLGGTTSRAFGVNETGQVVGSSLTATGTEHAFLWTQAAGMSDLGTLGGSLGIATAVNDYGQIAGTSTTADGAGHAVLWAPAGGMADLGTLGGTNSNGMFVNASGQVAGVSQTADGTTHAFQWSPGLGMVDVGTLGGSSRPTAMNDFGQIVGISVTATGSSHAFFWSPESGIVDLGTLGAPRSEASDINNEGEVVGITAVDFFTARMFSWTKATGMVDLGPMVLTGPMYRPSVNDDGLIASTVEIEGETHAVILAPDTTPPELSVPADMSANATSPDGAIVEFTASATDDNSVPPAVSCVPASGSVFAIGDTTVSCTATDTAGNTASGEFEVHVKGAAEQLVELAEAVSSIGPGTSLADKVEDAQAAVREDRVARACSTLDGFVNQVRALSGKGIPAGTAEALVAASTRIRAVLDC